jgi:aspartate-semialdehyde dehydrogenase
VGRELIPLFQKRNITIGELRLFGSSNSAGKTIQTPYGDKVVQILSEENLDGLDVIFFAAGGDVSAEWCPRAAQKGIICIDKSSVFRMNPDIPLIVPEVNGGVL